MIIEKLITLIFSFSAFKDINISLPASWFGALRSLFGAAMIINDVFPLSHVASSITFCVLFTLACAICRFTISIIRG